MKKLLIASTVLLYSMSSLALRIPPIPDGVTIVSQKEFGMTDKEIAEERAKSSRITAKGYLEQDSSDAKELLLLKKYPPSFSDKNEYDDFGSDFKKSLSNIKLAFKFNQLSFVPQDDVLGFAVAYTYIKERGWTGVTEYFIDKKTNSVCHYIVHNMKLSKAGALLREDVVKRSVNKKVTIIDIEGNYNTGFLYTFDWFDETFMHRLRCANAYYSLDLTSAYNEIAKKIDKEMSANGKS